MKMLRLIAAAVLGAVLVTGASAAPEGAGPHGPAMSVEDMGAIMDAKVAGLKAGLKLTAAQEKLWPALETALRDNAKARMSQMRDHKAAGEHSDALASMVSHAQILSARGAQMQKLADATKPLYDTFDDGQKRRFGMLIRHVIGGHGHGRHGEHGGHGGH